MNYLYINCIINLYSTFVYIPINYVYYINKIVPPDAMTHANNTIEGTNNYELKLLCK